MTVHIFDADALDRLALVEGAQWRADQDADRGSPYGFHAWLAAWESKQRMVAENPEYADEPVASFMERSGDGALYGAGGWHRYLVTPAGELVLARWSSTERRMVEAEAAGFLLR